MKRAVAEPGRLRTCCGHPCGRRARRPLRLADPSHGIERERRALAPALPGPRGRGHTADGQFGPATAASLRAFEQAEDRRANGVASRSDQRARAQSRGRRGRGAAGGATLRGAPRRGRATLSGAARRLRPPARRRRSRRSSPRATGSPASPTSTAAGTAAGADSGYDCSGSVSYVLHAAGLLDTALDSSGLARFGERGRGDWVTIRANAGHAYLIVAGLRFDTSARKRGASRWTDAHALAARLRGAAPREPLTRARARGARAIRSGVAWPPTPSHRSHPRYVTGSRARSSVPPPPRRRRGRRSPAGRNVLVSAPTGSGKTLAAFLWGARSAGGRARRAAPHPPGLRLAAEGPLLRRGEEPPRAAQGHRRGRVGGHPHRRHAAEGAPGDAAQPARRAHHHAGVALPDAHLAGARVPRGRRGGDRRRDPRRGAHQARRPPRPHARAARAPGGPPAPADRPVGHAAPARGGRPLPRGRRPRLRGGGRRRAQAARPEDPRARGEHARAGRAGHRPSGDRDRRHGRGRRRPDGPRPRIRGRVPRRRSARSGRRSTPSCSS